MTDLQQIESRLWDYIDGNGDIAERSAIEKLIQENKEWKEKYNELLEVHQLIGSTDLDEPSLRFTKNVMEEIAKYQIAPAAKEYINKKIIWGIAAFFITLIVSFFLYGISQVNWSEGSTGSGLGIDFSKVDYSRMFNNTYMNVFMMANVVLGLMLFDRYLSNKNKKLKEA